MKKFTILILSVILITISCKAPKKEEVKETETPKAALLSFGEKISEENALSTVAAYEKLKTLKVGDTTNVKFTSKINDVCQKKGCWMTLPMGAEEEVMVRFKDYGFFMPLDSKGKEVIVEGKAFLKVTPVDELRHYAEDAGKSKEEIEKITEPKEEIAFVAHGVLMK